MIEKNSPVLKKTIPDQLVYAALDCNPLDLNDFIANTLGSDGEIVFTVTLSDGQPSLHGAFCLRPLNHVVRFRPPAGGAGRGPGGCGPWRRARRRPRPKHPSGNLQRPRAPVE